MVHSDVCLRERACVRVCFFLAAFSWLHVNLFALKLHVCVFFGACVCVAAGLDNFLLKVVQLPAWLTGTHQLILHFLNSAPGRGSTEPLTGTGHLTFGVDPDSDKEQWLSNALSN